MAERLYSVGTWDGDAQAYTPQIGVPSFNLTMWQLRNALRLLKRRGCSCFRFRDPDGNYESDWCVLVERTDGLTEEEIREGWKR